MRVIAIQDGTWGKGKTMKRVRKGQAFDVPQGVSGKWFVPAPAAVEAPNAEVKPADKGRTKTKADDLT